MLALLGLKRLRNLVLIVAPYAVSVPLALAVSDRLETATAIGLVALVLAPGALLAPALVTAAGGRRGDMAGALVLGTAILSFVLVSLRPGATTVALTASQAFAVASLIAGAVPTVRDRILAPLRWAGNLAALVVIALALASGPRIDALSAVVALATLALTLGIAAAAARSLGRDVPSALAAVGTRDPIVAIALAWSIGGADATAVPLAGAVILGIASAALIIRRR
jgi:hypothetical protein